MTFRQIKNNNEINSNKIKDDFREIAHINIKSSDLTEKFNIDFADFYADGLGESKIASFITISETPFFIEEFPFNRVVQTYIGCLYNIETLSNDLDEVLEALEITTKDVFWHDEKIKFQPHQLWRQDDNGHKFLIETFPCKADAVKAMKEFEARLHKQTYWIEKVL